MNDSIRVEQRMPTLAEYVELISAVDGDEVVNPEVAERALRNSLYGAVALDDADSGRIVGMGRIVGDGAIFFYLQDIAVLPEYQGRGTGSRIVAQLLDYIRVNAPPLAFVGLFAARNKETFYERFGFQEWPILKGMFQTTPAPSDGSDG